LTYNTDKTETARRNSPKHNRNYLQKKIRHGQVTQLCGGCSLPQCIAVILGETGNATQWT